jgi:predicted RNase H-like nuclease (RuvC/YqgF family)
MKVSALCYLIDELNIYDFSKIINTHKLQSITNGKITDDFVNFEARRFKQEILEKISKDIEVKVFDCSPEEILFKARLNINNDKINSLLNEISQLNYNNNELEQKIFKLEHENYRLKTELNGRNK